MLTAALRLVVELLGARPGPRAAMKAKQQADRHLTR